MIEELNQRLLGLPDDQFTWILLFFMIAEVVAKNKLINKMLKIVDNYTLTEYLGKGEYGKVFKAFNIDTKIDVAIKMIPLSKF